MPADVTIKPASRLVLDSHLDELAKVWPWADAILAEYPIPADTQYAIHLCLEEALSNVIRHGYTAQSGQPVTVECRFATDELLFVIEDHAAAFNPLEERGGAAPPSSIEELPLGGRGIQLIRKFAGSVSYERLPDGNRLIIGFPVPGRPQTASS